MASDTAPEQQPSRLGLVVRLLVLAAAIAFAVTFLASFRGDLSLDSLASREVQLRATVESHPYAALATAFAIYVAVTGLSLPGAAAMSVAYGWLFGFWKALMLVNFASTAGATIAFLFSRYLLGQWIQARYGVRLTAINAAIDREGAFYLLTLRLIPQVPFFVVNAAMGLTKIRVGTYWWVSQLGMLPGTIVFVFAGASAPSLKTVADRGLASILDGRLIAALGLLAVLPLAIKWSVSRFRGPRQM